ncbi:hypothetical protein NDU88_006301 [Pleurodeles waltl]|uniref:Uncharacterized protein n=1 Tax=Pleurodeles waltl TaxID=8319 RepID=A0AAV7RPQ2_PLEWA|nr:hypothetical protein NDU88_006301 [Pleurodeles waltl]
MKVKIRVTCEQIALVRPEAWRRLQRGHLESAVRTWSAGPAPLDCQLWSGSDGQGGRPIWGPLSAGPSRGPGVTAADKAEARDAWCLCSLPPVLGLGVASEARISLRYDTVLEGVLPGLLDFSLGHSSPAAG